MNKINCCHEGSQTGDVKGTDVRENDLDGEMQSSILTET